MDSAIWLGKSLGKEVLTRSIAEGVSAINSSRMGRQAACSPQSLATWCQWCQRI